ncbi:tRNA-dihydrouridine synthase B [uncultured archaeon]|nr:tRNA-dihydrouridine synthase B [uncultured archaeon]
MNISNKAFLSPIHEYTDSSFRLMCSKYGCDYVSYPILNAFAVSHDYLKLSSIDVLQEEKNLAIQLCGNSPEDFQVAGTKILNELPNVIRLDVNSGCPSSNTREAGGGSALLDKPETLKEIMKTVKKLGLPTSCKIRLSNSIEKTLSVVDSVCNEVDFLIVHGRTVKQGYSGSSDWNTIKLIKERVSIPVVGNGDVKSKSHGLQLVSEGYCDAFMIAREAMSNPLAFSNIVINSFEEELKLFNEYYELSKGTRNENLFNLKYKALMFFRGFSGSTEVRLKISRVKTVEELVEMLDSLRTKILVTA